MKIGSVLNQPLQELELLVQVKYRKREAVQADIRIASETLQRLDREIEGLDKAIQILQAEGNKI